jgi:ATP-binding cassette, subfamily B, bacterial
MRNPYFSLLSTAWQYASKERKQFVLIYAMFIAANLVIAMFPLLYGWFIDALQREGTKVLDYAWLYGAAYLGLKIIEWAFHGPARVMERQLAFRMSQNFLDELYNKILHLPVKWHKDHHSGATINRIRKAYEALKEFFQHGFVYIQALGKFLISIVAMLYFSPVYGILGVLIGIFTIWVIRQFDKPFVKAIHEQNEKDHEVSATLFDSLSNIITVITLRLENRMQSGLMQKVSMVFPAFKRQITINEWKWCIASILVAVIYVVNIIGYVHQHYVPGEIFFIGGLVTLLAYVNQFTSVFHDVAYQYTRIVQYNTDVQAANTITEAYANQHRPIATEPIPAEWNSIEISNLNFRHPHIGLKHGQPQGLYNLSIRIQQGQRIALIGESGSGKSTLLALLRGLYSPEPDTRISVDGQLPFEFGDIANAVTLFPQEPEIFENTILYNITLGLPFSEDDVLRACEAAQFAEVIKQLPNGLETSIKEKGVNLSGGQKQRLALARGILAARSSKILLMDEPTSSVDPRTEVHIYNRLFDTFASKAVISSLHRLHLLSKFDYVYILEKGHIIDQGTFEELKRSSPVFQSMWQHQQESQQPATEPVTAFRTAV